MAWPLYGSAPMAHQPTIPPISRLGGPSQLGRVGCEAQHLRFGPFAPPIALIPTNSPRRIGRPTASSAVATTEIRSVANLASTGGVIGSTGPSLFSSKDLAYLYSQELIGFPNCTLMLSWSCVPNFHPISHPISTGVNLPKALYDGRVSHWLQ